MSFSCGFFIHRTLPTWRSFHCIPFSTISQVSLRRLLLSSLLCLRSPKLRWGSVLLWPLRLTDGTDTSDSLRAKVSTVSVLSGEAGDTLVDPAQFSYSQRVPLRSRPLENCILPFPPDVLRYSLAVGGLGAPGDGVRVLGRVLGVAGLLGDQDDTAILSGLHPDGLKRG